MKVLENKLGDLYGNVLVIMRGLSIDIRFILKRG